MLISLASSSDARGGTTSPIERTSAVIALAVAVVTAIIFWRTAYPSITWWDSSGYSLAAATLGIYSPPGSLLLTLIGWPVTRLAGGNAAARALDVTAAVLAALTVALVYVAAVRALDIASADTRDQHLREMKIGAAFGAFTLAFCGTLWAYAGMFTPYILTPLFTAIILWTMLRWWRSADPANDWRWLALLGLAFGLDSSVHRTNALLIPSAFVWVLIREPRTFRAPRAVAAAMLGLTIGLSAQLAILPIAAHTRSPLDFAFPNSTLAGLWDYASVKMRGGGFLFSLYPRKAPFWHVQTMDFLRVLANNFLHWERGPQALALLPGAAALLGLGWLWRRNARLGAAFAAVIVLQSICTVVYFNIPANFFRTFDRHYLPVCVTIGVLVACGLGVAGKWLSNYFRHRSSALGIAAAGALGMVPLSQLISRWSAHDASRQFFAHDYAVNVLQSLPAHAIYFTVGDNDSFPVWYVQSVEGMRPDVTTINLSVANVPAWPDRERERDASLPLSLSSSQRTALVSKPWVDTALTLRVHGRPSEFGLAPSTRLPASIQLDVHPASGDRMSSAEIVLLDIFQSNDWKRPLTFSITGERSALEWLAPYGRLDGLYYRVVPISDPAPDAPLLRTNLLQKPEYRGYADRRVPLSDVTIIMGLLAYYGAAALLSADDSAHAIDQCHADRHALLELLPPARLSPPAELLDPITSACGATTVHGMDAR
ncbi:MAG TPA: DUF2723 domain-containing protein [Gemmatimonadaceae bacterium]